MDIEKIEQLVKIIENSSLMEFNYSDENVDISMSKLDNPPIVAAGAPVVSQAQAPAQIQAAEKEDDEDDDDEEFITSPIVGTFYSAPAPDAQAFVKVGEHIKNGQTVCILEAMKLMNEIQCEFDCEIEAVLVSNEQKVEYGQPLFRVKRL